MLVPLSKFVVYTLVPALVMIWCTTPDLWGRISHTLCCVGADPGQFMLLLEDIPGRAQDILATSENVVRSLTCDDLKLTALNPAPLVTPNPTPLPFPPSEILVPLISEEDLDRQELRPKCVTWLLGGMLLMGLDSYFPRLSAVSSLWTPLQAAIPVLHWMVSWWILPPGWELKLVSLAPLSHTYNTKGNSMSFPRTYLTAWINLMVMTICGHYLLIRSNANLTF
ncbi:hypothetical protein DSO57_1037123 [Entomophthora muscae]|uniref:Uncharacterized protein n=1 Tax=Entomophthora muscae TaxID=34485 RepID=A0ACC2T9T2_9FUNG|nr:hypothetical protein DSO57_1037123 [Entomophthora muscae]